MSDYRSGGGGLRRIPKSGDRLFRGWKAKVSTWDAAKARASAEGRTLSFVLDDYLERYAKGAPRPKKEDAA